MSSQSKSDVIGMLEKRAQGLRASIESKNAIISKLGPTTITTTSSSSFVNGSGAVYSDGEEFNLKEILESKNHFPAPFMLKVLNDMIETMKSPKKIQELDAFMASNAPPLSADDYDPARVQAAETQVFKLLESVWTKYGVSSKRGDVEIQNLAFGIETFSLSATLRDDLSDALESYSSAQEDIIARLVLGEEEFTQIKAEQQMSREVMNEVLALRSTQSPQEQLVYLNMLNDQYRGIHKKYLASAKSQSEMRTLLSKVPQEEKRIIVKFQAYMSMMQQGSSHGHSHDGKPCGGHGHSHAAPASHGHSHDGKPCGGHGHAHGGDEDYEEEEEEDDDDDEDHHGHSHAASHGHSHDGKPCGGHGHSHN